MMSSSVIYLPVRSGGVLKAASRASSVLPANQTNHRRGPCETRPEPTVRICVNIVYRLVGNGWGPEDEALLRHWSCK